MSQNETLPPDLLIYEVSTDPNPLYINDPDSKLLITIKKNEAVYLDEIFIEVPAEGGSKADTLFLTDPALTYRMTPENHWEIEGPNTILKSEKPPTQSFTIKSKGSANQITEDLHVTITGTTNADEGTVQVLIGEHSGHTAGDYHYRETRFSVTKSEPIPFYLNNLVAANPIDPNTPKLSFKRSDEIRLNWDSNGASYKLFPEDLVTSGNPTADTHITIPAGVMTKDQTVVIRATKGSKTLYRSFLIHIEDPELTSTSSLISGAGTGKSSFSVADGQSTINGDQLSVSAPTTVKGDLTVQAPASGTSTTQVDTLRAANAHITGTTHTHGDFRMYGDTATQQFRSDLPVWFNAGMTVVGAITANGGIQVPAINPVSLSQPPLQLIIGKQTASITRILKVNTQGYAMIPALRSWVGLTSFKATAQVTYPGSSETVTYTYKYVNQFIARSPDTMLIIPLTQGASATFTFSLAFLGLPGQYIDYQLFWMPMGNGPGNTVSFTFEPPAPGSAEAIEGERIDAEHQKQAEKLVSRTENIKSFIRNLEEAFEETLGAEAHASLAQNLEELL